MLKETSEELYEYLKDKGIEGFPDTLERFQKGKFSAVSSYLKAARAGASDEDKEKIAEFEIKIADEQRIERLHALLNHHKPEDAEFPRNVEEFAKLGPAKISEMVSGVVENVSHKIDNIGREASLNETQREASIEKLNQDKSLIHFLEKEVVRKMESSEIEQETRRAAPSSLKRNADGTIEQPEAGETDLDARKGAEEKKRKDDFKKKLDELLKAKISPEVDADLDEEERKRRAAAQTSGSTVSISGDGADLSSRSASKGTSEQLILEDSYFQDTKGTKFLKEIQSKDGKYSYEVQKENMAIGAELTIKTPRVDKNGKDLVPPIFDVIVLDHEGKAKSIDIVREVEGRVEKLSAGDKSAGVSKLSQKWLDGLERSGASLEPDRVVDATKANATVSILDASRPLSPPSVSKAPGRQRAAVAIV